VVPSTEQLADIYLKSTAYESLAKDLAREHTDSRREYYVRHTVHGQRHFGGLVHVHTHILTVNRVCSSPTGEAKPDQDRKVRRLDLRADVGPLAQVQPYTHFLPFYLFGVLTDDDDERPGSCCS
jgi:hypothetical protein